VEGVLAPNLADRWVDWALADVVASRATAEPVPQMVVRLEEPAAPPALVELEPLDDAAGLMADGCGRGAWCPSCQEDIRSEAFAWLRALSESYDMGVGAQTYMALGRRVPTV
jgi:hypothetical protein